MSAIYGVVGNASVDLLEAMGERLQHRGERHAEWQTPSGISLGCRWSDLTADLTPSQDVPAVLDGFVTRRSALPERASGGSTDSSLSGASLLLDLFRLSGPSAFRQLRGPFAAALAVDDSVVLARDPLGYRQLYYTRTASRFLFASEYKALLADPNVEARPDRDALQHIHQLKTQPPTRTCLEGVFPVPPGCCVSLSDGSPVVTRYWDFSGSASGLEREDMVDGLRRRMLEALRTQAERGDSIGVALSGGLDSAVTLAMLREVVGDREIQTFSAGYGEGDPELTGAAEVAEYFGTSHHPIILAPDELPEVLPRTVWHMEEPVGREDTPYLYRTCRIAARSVDVLFSGYDADLLFGGMPRHLLFEIGRLLPPARSALEGFLEYARFGREPSSLAGRMLVRLYYRGKAYPAPKVLGAGQVIEADLEFGRSSSGSGPLTDHLSKQARATSHGMYDALHQAFGVHMASPFGDQDVIDWAFRLPDDVKVRRFNQKWILREAAKGLLPERARKLPKTLQRLRHDEEFSRVLQEMAKDLLAPERVRQRGLFDPDYVAKARSRPSGGNPYTNEQSYRLWSLILTELWAQAFLDQRGEPSATAG